MASNAAEASSSDQDYTTSVCNTSSSTEDSQDELVEKARRALQERERKRVNDAEVLAKLHELKDEVHKSSKERRVPTFTYVSNKEQNNFNEEVMGELKRSTKKASSKVAKGITATIEKVRKRQQINQNGGLLKSGLEDCGKIPQRRHCFRCKRSEEDQEGGESCIEKDEGREAKEEECIHEQEDVQGMRRTAVSECLPQ